MMVRIEGSVPVIELPEHLGFEPLRAWIREQLPLHAEVIGGRSSRLDLGGRQIKLFDLRRVLHLLREDFGIDVTGVYVDEEKLHRFAERELKLKVFLHKDELPAELEDLDAEAPTELMDAADDAAEATEGELVDAGDAADEDVAASVVDDAGNDAEEGLPSTEALANTTLPNDLAPVDSGVSDETPRPTLRVARQEPSEPRVRTIKGTMRSGNHVRFEGDILVYGDVNPGAQLIATGNISVLGALKGMAHAGAGGNEDAFILALHLRPTQLRIGRKIAVPPDRDQTALPERARVDGDQIVIEPFGSSRRG